MEKNINSVEILEEIKRELENLLSSINHVINDNKRNAVDTDETQAWINQFNRIIQNLDQIVETLEKFKSLTK